ncbi:MAG: vWA domain-containing protein, partial [Myxococcota bacterium]
SSSGSFERRRRPLAVAMAVSRMLRRAAATYLACWTPRMTKEELFGIERDRPEADLFAVPRGSTNLAGALLRALRWRPNLVVLVSDGYENDPPGAATQVVRAYRERIDSRVAFVHANPVFDAERFVPRPLGPDLPTVGIRNAVDLPTGLEFAAFSWGASLSVHSALARVASREPRPLGSMPFEAYLDDLVGAYLGGGG